MSDTSLGMPTAQPASDDHGGACDRFCQHLQRLSLLLLVGIVFVGAAAVTTATIRPSVAIPVTAASITACVASVVALMLWTIVRAPADTRRRRAAKASMPPRVHTQSTDVPWPATSQTWFQPGNNGDGGPGTGTGRHRIGAVPATEAEPHDVEDPGATTEFPHRREVWVVLARRLQTLTYRAIRTIDDLENRIEDPEILAGIYKVDNLISLVRRKGENIAVLGGDPPQRRSNSPVELHKVLIASLSEVERFKQVAIVPTFGTFAVHGYVAAEIIHLLAELLENATQFTDPDGPKVEVRAYKVTAGLAIEIQDRGLGVEPEVLHKINGMLDGTATLDIDGHLRAGQIGLAVVRELGHRNGVAVQLQTNIYGGVSAVVVLPSHLLVDPTAEPPSAPALPPAALPAALPSPSPRRPALTVADSPPPSAPTPLPGLPAPAVAAPLPTRVSGTRVAANDPTRGEQSAPQKPRPGPSAYPPGTYAPVPEPPPLPQRNGTFMHPALNAPAAAPAPPVPGHNTTLFADARAGRDHWLSGQSPADSTAERTRAGTDAESHPGSPNTHPDPTAQGQTWPMS